MQENQSFRQGIRGCLISLVVILFAIGALAISAIYQHPGHPACGGMLGAGFPMLYICDDWGGGSPTSSWEKIDYVDVLNGGIRPISFSIDFLFYLVLIWLVWVIASRLLHKGVKQRDFWWATLILMGFISGFLCASLAFQSSDLSMREFYARTPTPVIPSATSIEPIVSMMATNSILSP